MAENSRKNEFFERESIAIIAILAGLLLPALNTARAKGISASCISNLKQAHLVFTNYASEQNDFFPLAYIPGLKINFSPFYILKSTGYTDISKGGVSLKIFDCPGDRSRGIGVDNGTAEHNIQKENKKHVNRSYAVNQALGYFERKGVYYAPYKIGKAKVSASKTILMADAHDYIATSNQCVYGLKVYDVPETTVGPDSHHQNRDNVVVVAGNVTSFKGIFTWRDTTVFENPPKVTFTYTP